LAGRVEGKVAFITGAGRGKDQNLGPIFMNTIR
jgi:hypothetical protein